MKVYIAEYMKSKSLLSRMISFFTKSDYTHTAMYIQTTKSVGYHCELDPLDDKGIFDKTIPDYHVVKYKTKEDFLENTPDKREIDLFELPITFKNIDHKKVLKWWKKHEKDTYGYFRLISSMVLAPLHKIMEQYVKRTNKPFPNFFFFNKGQNVCSMAVDTCVKESLGYDIFPKYPQRVAYPGLFAKTLKKYFVL